MVSEKHNIRIFFIMFSHLTFTFFSFVVWVDLRVMKPLGVFSSIIFSQSPIGRKLRHWGNFFGGEGNWQILRGYKWMIDNAMLYPNNSRFELKIWLHKMDWKNDSVHMESNSIVGRTRKKIIESYLS